MIHQIYSPTIDTFKTMSFRSGLNIVYVEKHPQSTMRETRNRAGKTSLIEIMHWLLGANLTENTEAEQFRSHRFGMRFDLGNEEVVVERTPPTESASSTILLKGIPSSKASSFGLTAPDMFGEYTLSVKDWIGVLGRTLFDLSEVEDLSYAPTFRTLLNYFIRRQRTYGFLSPELIFRQQRPVSYQVNLTYLLGLDWTTPQEWEQVRQKERQTKELRQAVSQGQFSEAFGTTSELRTLLAIAENKLQKLIERIQAFRVHESYRELEEEAATLAIELRDLSNANQIDRELIKELNIAIKEEKSSVSVDLEQLYAEIGIVLPDEALRRFEDVQAFHQAVIQNRRLYLQSQINDAEQRVTVREQTIRRLNNRNNQIASALSSHGALDQLTNLQAERGRLEGEIANLRERFQAAQTVEGQKTRLEIERQQLRLRLMQDYEEQSERLNRAIVIYEDISKQLYKDAGSFSIEPTTNGPQFQFTIHGSKSEGIQKMQIFCFDMMLVRLSCERDISPKVLVHDSHLFDGVDTRQVRGALRVGAQMAEEFGFQYIVTLNSDQLNEEEDEDMTFEPYIVSPRLHDRDETGGLFGFRYG